MQVYGDELLAQASLKLLRRSYPRERIILCSDGGSADAVEALGKQCDAEIYVGERLYGIEHGGAIWQRALEFFVASPTQFFVKIDPDTRIDRSFTFLPSKTVMSGDCNSGGFIQGGCIIIPKSIAQTLVASGLLVSQKSRTYALERFETIPDWLRPSGLPRINTDWLLHWACKTLGIHTEQHPEVYSDWMLKNDNADQVFAVVHPDKFLHHSGIVRQLLLEHHYALLSILSFALAKSPQAVSQNLYDVQGSVFVGFRGNAGDELMLRSMKQHFPNGHLSYVRGENMEGDVLLDASGYYYGAPWGEARLRMMARKISVWKAQGKCIILLPQSFGPFHSDNDRLDMQEILRHADCVYARENESFELLQTLSSSTTRLRLAPDFTSHVPAIFSEDYRSFQGSVAIVPNKRMLDQTDSSCATAYIPFLLHAMRAFESCGKTVFLLAHESKDVSLCEEVKHAYGRDISVVVEKDAQVLKGIIARCYAVVGSRYHALVSALSQGVPAIGAGWHSKYDALYRLYRSQNLLMDVVASPQDIEASVSQVCDEEYYGRLQERLFLGQQAHARASRAMWMEIDSILSHRASKTLSICDRLRFFYNGSSRTS